MSMGLNEKRGKKIANKIGNQPDCFITDVTMVYISLVHYNVGNHICPRKLFGSFLANY